MTFEAEVTGDPAVTNGIFTCQSGVVQPIVVQGQPKPGTAAVFGINPSDPWISDDGRVAFIDTTSPSGVFITGNIVLATAPADIPTLGPWGMLLLASLLGGLGMLWHARSGRGAG